MTRSRNTARVLSMAGFVLAMAGTHGVSIANDVNDPALMSVSPVAEHTCIAVPLQVQEGAVVAAVTWFNNDGTSSFPHVFLVERDEGAELSMTNVVRVQGMVAGGTAEWSTVSFEPPLLVSERLVYAVFELPPHTEYASHGDGGGPAIGVVDNHEGLPALVSSAGASWIQVGGGTTFDVRSIGTLARGGFGAPPSSTLPAPEGWWSRLPNVAARSHAGAAEAVDEDVAAPMTRGLELAARPNPFNPRTELSFRLASKGSVQLLVYDVRGRLVKSLVDGVLGSGEHSIVWSGHDDAGAPVASGVYHVSLATPFEQRIVRVTLVR